MTDHERILSEFATLTEESISKAFKHLEEKYEWVDTKEEAVSLMSRLRGNLIASLCGEIEEITGIGFAKIISQLSDKPDLKTSKFRHENMPETSSLKGRAQIMWAIRLAFTHGNGDIAQIDDANVAAYLFNKHLDDVTVEANRVVLGRKVTFPSIRTTVEILEKFK